LLPNLLRENEYWGNDWKGMSLLKRVRGRRDIK